MAYDLTPSKIVKIAADQTAEPPKFIINSTIN